MGLEKNGSKGGGGYVGGLLQLFDWNGKSRKRLSYNEFDLPESTKQGKRSDENLPSTRFSLSYGNESGRLSSAKGSTDHSCASSTTDDETNGTRAPGVVARLMGLDSLPTSNVNEPYSTPFFEPHSVRGAHYQRTASQFYGEHQNTMSQSHAHRGDDFRRRAAESRPHKVPSSPIERFQCETLPLRVARPHPTTHNKLLSPIKSPGFISPKNVAVIMEAAARILEPGYQAGPKGKSPSFGSSSAPIKTRNIKENAANSQRPMRPSEISKKPVETSAVKYLKGQSLNKSWNGSDDTPIHRTSPNSEENQSAGLKNKGKSISLAIQAKVNVQRREGLSSSGKSLLVHKEQDEYKLNESARSQPTAPKNRQNKSSISNVAGVLRQNNQKQNCPANKDKLSLKPTVSNQQGKKVLSGDGSLGRNKASHNLTGSSRVGKKEGTEMAGLEREASSSRTKNFPRKKRAISGDLYSDKCGVIDTILVDRDAKLFQPQIAINEHPNQGEDSRRQGMDVVSFTFTSPMRKPTIVSKSSGQMVEKQNTTNICFVDQNGKSDARGKKISSAGLNVISGDALSILLEQKLRELTSGVESSSGMSSGKTEMISTFAPIIQDIASPFTAVGSIPREAKKYLTVHQKEELVGGFSSGCSSINDQVLKVNSKFQESEKTAECSSSNTRKELDFQQPSPVSILEASFSNETSNSSESWGSSSTNGNKMSSPLQAQSLGVTCLKNILSMEAETELSDSASSMLKGTVDIEHATEVSVSGKMKTDQHELKYVRELLHNTELKFKDLPLNYAHDLIDPLLFDKLENWKIEWINEGDVNYCKRRELFDFVKEFVDMKCSHYNRGGYITWAQGVVVVQKEGLAEEIFKEILQCRSMGDWMVDELVERDMSKHSEQWLDFEREAFEIGEEMEREILSSLIDEVVADFL